METTDRRNADLSIEQWVTNEQELLWDRLHDDFCNAINGEWSIAASSTAIRIVGAARLVGPTDAGSVPWPLVASGTYHQLLDLAGITYDTISDAQWANWDELMTPKNGPRHEISRQWAARREAMQADAAWIMANV